MNWPFIFRKKPLELRSASELTKSDMSALASGMNADGGMKRARVTAIREVSKGMQEISDVQRKMVRMYDAALTDNLNQDCPISLTSANAEIITSQIAVRSRARSAERNDGYAAGIIWENIRNIGGPDPFRLEMKVGSEDDNGKFTAESKVNREIMEAWKWYGRKENCTVRKNMSRKQVQWIAIASMTRDGAILARHRGWMNSSPILSNGKPAKPFDGNPIRYALQLLEIDRLDQQWCIPKKLRGDDSEIQFGIEVDENGAPTFYHILTRHPGDYFANSSTPKYRERVPVEDVILLNDIQTRPEQYISISRLAPILRLLHRLQQFDIAHITAALTTCCKTIWITKTVPNAPEFIGDHIDKFYPDIVGGDTGDNGGTGDIGGGGYGNTGQGARQVNVTPGEINTLEYGQEPKVLDPRFPVEAGPAFKKDLLRCVAAGAQVWYNQIAQDLESVNFASGRLGEMASRDVAMMSQNHVIDMFVRPHFEEWLKYWLMSGETKLPFSRYLEFCKAAIFNGRRWDYTNPMQDVQAAILKIEAGLTSRSAEISESYRGGDAEEVNREQEEDRESDKRHNLDFSAQDVTKPTIQKGTPGEDVPNPFEAGQENNGKKPLASSSDNKTKGIDFDRLERAYHALAKIDDEFVESGQYADSLAFLAQMRKSQIAKRRSEKGANGA